MTSDKAGLQSDGGTQQLNHLPPSPQHHETITFTVSADGSITPTHRITARRGDKLEIVSPAGFTGDIYAMRDGESRCRELVRSLPPGVDYMSVNTVYTIRRAARHKTFIITTTELADAASKVLTGTNGDLHVGTGGGTGDPDSEGDDD